MPTITPVTNKPSATTYQVGATVYIPYGITAVPQAAVVEETESVVVDANSDGTGEQTNYYYFAGMPKTFRLAESLVFSSKANLETYLDGVIDDA